MAYSRIGQGNVVSVYSRKKDEEEKKKREQEEREKREAAQREAEQRKAEQQKAEQQKRDERQAAVGYKSSFGTIASIYSPNQEKKRDRASELLYPNGKKQETSTSAKLRRIAEEDNGWKPKTSAVSADQYNSRFTSRKKEEEQPDYQAKANEMIRESTGKLLDWTNSWTKKNEKKEEWKPKESAVSADQYRNRYTSEKEKTEQPEMNAWKPKESAVSADQYRNSFTGEKESGKVSAVTPDLYRNRFTSEKKEEPAGPRADIGQTIEKLNHTYSKNSPFYNPSVEESLPETQTERFPKTDTIEKLLHGYSKTSPYSSMEAGEQWKEKQEGQTGTGRYQNVRTDATDKLEENIWKNKTFAIGDPTVKQGNKIVQATQQEQYNKWLLGGDPYEMTGDQLQEREALQLKKWQKAKAEMDAFSTEDEFGEFVNNDNAPDYAKAYSMLQDDRERTAEEDTARMQNMKQFADSIALYDDWNSEENLRDFYDLVNGDFAYEELTENATEEEKNRVNALISSAMDYVKPVTQHANEAQAKREELENTFNQANSDLLQTRKVEEGMQEIGKYENGVGADWDSEYHEELIADKYANKGIFDWGNDPTKTDDLYRRLNTFAKESSQITPEQLQTFNAYYNRGMYDEAEAYYEALEPFLNNKQAKEEYRELQEKVAEYPTEYAVLRLPLNLISGIAGIFNTIGALSGDKNAQDPFSSNYKATRAVGAIASKQTEIWGDTFARMFGEDFRKHGEFLCGVKNSLEDNLMNGAVAAGLTGAQKAGEISTAMVQILMSSQVMATSLEQNLEQHMDPVEASIRGIGDGVIEAITEKYGIEAVLKPDVKALMGSAKDIAGYLMKAYASESSEELFGNILGFVYDGVVSSMAGHENEIQLKIRQAMAADKNLTVKQAAKQVWGEWWGETAKEMAAAGLSMMLTGGARVATNAASYYRAGNNVYDFGRGNMQTEKSGSSGNAGIDMIVEAGMNMDPESNSYKQAEQIRKDIEAGKKPSNKKIGRTAYNIIMESGGQVREATQNALTQTIADELESKGVDNPDEARTLGEIVTKATTQGIQALNRSERAQLMDNDLAYRTYVAMVEPDSMKGNRRSETKALEIAEKAKGSVWEKTGQQRQQINSIQALTEGKLAKGAVKVGTTRLEQARKIVKVADDTALNTAEGQRTFRNSEAVVDDGERQQIGSIEGINGGKVMVRLEGQENPVAYNIEDVAPTHGEAAALIGYMKANPGMMTEETASKALASLDAAGEKAGGTFADNVVAINLAARLGQSMPVHSMDNETAHMLYDAAAEDASRAREARIRNNVEVKPGQGKANWDGAEYGTKEWTEKARGLSDEQRNQARGIGEIAKITGMNISLINDENHKETNGWYNPDGSITLNLAAENADGTKHHLLVTAAHEATHLLQENSKEGYDALQKFVLDELRKSGVDVEDRIQKKINEYNKYYSDNGMDRQMTIDDAIYEIVADGCDQILGSDEMAARLKTENETLFGQIKGYVQRFVAKIRNAIAGMGKNASFESSMIQDADELAKRWLGAYDEVIHREVVEGQQEQEINETALAQDIESSNGEETNYGDHQKFSVRVTDEDELKTLNNQKTITTYKTMQLIDGKLYPPMAAVVAGNMEDYSELGQWEKATEHPELIKNGNKFTLNKGKGKGQLDAAYNPYMHSSNLMINDQFSGAYNRDNLVTVECEVPVSELDSGYHAEFAKDSTGWHSWHTGTVAGQLRNTKGIERQVMLSRWIKPVRIVSESEVAQHYKQLLDGTDIQVPDNVVTPQLLTELKKAGVHIKESGKVSTKAEGIQFSIRDTNGNTVTLSEERAEENKKIVSEMSPVITIEGGKFQKNTSANFKEMATEYFDSIGNKATSKVFGDVRLDENGIKHLISWLTSRRAGVLEAIKPVIENGEIVHIAEKIGKHNFDSATISAPIVYDGKPYYMAVVIKQDAEGNNSYYMHDAIIAEIKKDQLPVNKSLSGQTLGSDPSIAMILSTIPEYNGISGKSENEQGDQNTLRTTMEEDQTEIADSDGNAVAEILPGGTVSAYSIRTVDDTVNDELVKMLVEKGYGAKRVKQWVKDVQGIAAMIAADKSRLDFDAVGGTMLKNNQEYVKTLDASTLCAKRLLYQGIFNEIQKNLPNTPLMPEDLINLVNMMKKRGLVTPCGICYVESRRRMLGKYAKEWINGYQGDYVPSVWDVTTTEGLEALRKEHPQAYDDFVAAMNAKGSANPKVVQLRTEYKGEIKNLTESQIKKVKEIGGLRVQSFSDFETVHLLDMMQAVMDMAAKDLTSQAYTKVPNFAWVFGDTGIKINLSLIGEGTGLDENGNLIFSSTEGMDFDEAMKLRNMYSKNVGTILVGMNDDHIIAAMGDDRIDFIIPFHKSGWSKREMAQVIGMSAYKDYTRFQNEKKIAGKKENGKGYKTIPNKTSKITNLEPVGPNGYWDFNKSGTKNAEKYLKLCAEDGRIPKFANFLVDNRDGSFSLPADNSKRSQDIRKGYWKLLIDFKMYDNNGKGSPQTEVTPKFNMEAARDVLNSYEGGANTLPTNHEVAKEFVDNYKAAHPGRKSFSFRTAADMDVNYWMMSTPETSLQTEAERELLRQYKTLRLKIDLDNEKIKSFQKRIADMESRQDVLTDSEKRQLQGLRIRLQNAQTTKGVHENQLAQVTSSEGYAGMMHYQSRIMNDFVGGKTQDEVQHSVERMEESAERTKAEIDKEAAALEELAQNQSVKQIRSRMSKVAIERMSKWLRKEYGSRINKTELGDELAKISLKLADGQDVAEDVEAVAGRILENIPGEAGEYLEMLRGMTITLGRGQVQELYGSHSSMKELRNKLAGTGIKVVQGEKSGLDSNWDELCDMIPALNRDTGEKDQIGELLDFITSQKEAGEVNGKKRYVEQLADVMTDVQAAAMAIDVGIVTDPKAKKQIAGLQQIILELSGRTEEAVKRMRAMSNRMDELINRGKKAVAWTDAMKRDVNTTIDYFDRVSKLAVKTAKQEKQSAIIQQLKDKHTQEMLKKNEEWRNLMERDRQARYQQDDNQAMRRRMNTVITRVGKLLSAPTNTKNIPEHMQGLARELLGTIVEADLSETGHKISLLDRKSLAELKRRLDAWNLRDGEYNSADLAQLGKENDDPVLWKIEDDLTTIRDAITEWNGKYNGKNKLDTLQQRGATLKRMQEAVGEIWSIIKAEQQVALGDRRVAVEDQAGKVRIDAEGKQKKEWTGKIGRVIAGLHKAIVSGNMTPEYFFRTLNNDGLDDLWNEYHRAENRNGLELAKAKEKLAEIADRYGYRKWDTGKRVTVQLESGDVQMTIGQLMSLYATWNREKTLGPEMSQHLEKGGFYVEESDPKEGIIGRKATRKEAHRVTAADMTLVDSLLTDEQKAFVDDVVRFMSNDLSQLGNEASMKAYGIKMYKESYYFPFQMWDGIRSKKSNDSSSAASRDRAFHPSFSKSRMHGANNALVLGDFMETATDHAAGMINYATMGLANETMQKVLNFTVTEGYGDTETKRNIRTVLEEAYGKEAMSYLRELQDQLNGGAVRTTKSLGDKAISLFRKNAVAGSLSVAAQQPLSYIRAAMMVSPKYLAMGLNPATWKGSYQEMLAHSGVAVIKNMGRFDMNFGQSAREFMMPDGKESAAQKIWGGITGAATALPEMMDRMTWTRMWNAVKYEQKAAHPEMDPKSDTFLDMVGERFNDLMRRTQVYDSVLVKSANMRSDNYWVKGLTSFMAEPTLTLNVLADAVRQSKGTGNMDYVAKAGATFILSAVLQSAVKGLLGAGRNPDDKKTFEENVLYRFGNAIVSEINPLNMIPGYNDIVTLIKKGDLSDDAMGAIGKIFTAGQTVIDMLLGNGGKKGTYRDVEDGVGQLLQLFTNLPAKNIMRDARAMWNFFIEKPYNGRETSGSVLKEQAIESIMNADTITTAILSKLGDAGYSTSNASYYQRIYEAQKAGDTKRAEEMTEYLTSAKGVKPETIRSGIKKLAKEEENVEFMTENGMDPSDMILQQVRDGKIEQQEAFDQLKKANPEKDENDIYWSIDRVIYKRDTGKDAGSGTYYRLWDAMDENKADAIGSAIEGMLKHGVEKKNIKSQVTGHYKQAYLQADNRGKVQIRDAIHKAYRKLGFLTEDADKIINKWK